MAAYYPRKVSTIKDLKLAYKDDFEVDHMDEDHYEWEEERKMYVYMVSGLIVQADNF